MVRSPTVPTPGSRIQPCEPAPFPLAQRVVALAAGLLVLLPLAVAPVGCGQGEQRAEVPWMPSLALAMEAAAQRDTDIFVFFHAPWCAICRRMEAEVFSEPGVVRALEGLVPVAVDIEALPHVAARYGVEAVPGVMVLTAEGGVRTFLYGGLDQGQLRGFLARATGRAL